MSRTVSISNDGKEARWVMGVMIPPGETRVFTEAEVPPELRPAADELPAEAAADPLLAWVDLPVGKLALGLPDLSDDDLNRLEGLEKAKAKPRASALAEITGERLRRAEAGTPGGLEGETAGDSEGGEV